MFLRATLTRHPLQYMPKWANTTEVFGVMPRLSLTTNSVICTHVKYIHRTPLTSHVMETLSSQRDPNHVSAFYILFAIAWELACIALRAESTLAKKAHTSQKM